MIHRFPVTLKKIALILLAAALTPFAAPPLFAQSRASAVRVWTCDIVSSEPDASAAGTLHPIRIIGAKNGTFNGKVVVESPDPVRGIKASITAISGEDGLIPAKNVQVRYAIPWEDRDWARPTGPDILLNQPPAQVERLNRHAYAPVWVTIKVPKDARPGAYSGTLTISAQGLKPTEVPVKLEVENWTLPDPQNYRVWTDFIESPDTLSVEYKVPLWSEKHWDLIAQSFKLLSDTGSRVVYVPLICHTNLGNEQSMVRWIPKGDGAYTYDFSVMDQYLDSAEKNLGTPKIIIFQVWDICMSKDSLNRGLWKKTDATGQARAALLGQGPRVTELDPKTRQTKMITLPPYDDPKSQALWGPLWQQVNQHLSARHLKNTAMLGLMPDLWPTKKEVAFWKRITGGIPWAIHGHAGDPRGVGIGKKGLYPEDPAAASDIGYAAFVYNEVFDVNPGKGRMYGWRDSGILASYLRGGDLNMDSPADIREYLAFDITGGQRGGGRMGGDFWPVLRDKSGKRVGAVYLRYPENNWRNLDISDWFLAPGPTGPLATCRLEELKEGAEECEARIAIESALVNPGQKGRLGDLADKAQAFLDVMQHAMWKTVWNDDADLASINKTSPDGRNPWEGLWLALRRDGHKMPDEWLGSSRELRATESAQGQKWFAQGWQDREKELFDLAGQVAAKLK